MGLVQFEDGRVVYYPYVPNRGAAFTFMAFFILVTVIHLVFMFKHRSWYYIPLVLGGICEIFGYYGRGWASRRPNSPGPFMLQLMLILISPVFIAATVYTTRNKLRQAMLDRPKRRCTSTSFFVIVDILAFCSQIGGGLVQITGNLKIMSIGDHVVLGGLILQLVTLAIYLVLVGLLHRQGKREARTSIHWQPYVWGLAVAVVTIWVRNLVRAIEFAQGFYGFVSQHEAMLYIFDALLMLIVMCILAGYHFGSLWREGGKKATIEKIDRAEIGKEEGSETIRLTPARFQLDG